MRNIGYGAALAAVILVVTALVLHQPHPVTASHFNAKQTNARALMSTIDVNALPTQEILSEADE